MKDKILKDYGWCQIIRRRDKNIIRYDKGGIVVKMVEHEISIRDAEKALINQQEAEKIIIEIMKKES